MTIIQLIILFAVIGAVFTFITDKVFHATKALWMSFLQHFCGVWFVFSGFVKAVDPMGTAFKMEQYFAEFKHVLEPTPFSFMNGMFTYFAEHSLGFSIFMILLEIILGIHLILGYKNKLTVWAFFIVMIFFTVLTGFTHLTGYVPNGYNFFDFAHWGVHNKNNMKVTDCGCFGDFIKLEPKTSFYKDLFLMVPTLLFLFKRKWMHEISNQKLGAGISLASLVGFFVFQLNNFLWNEPIIDFRPFQNGVNITEKKKAEDDAVSKVEIIGGIYRNEKTGEEAKENFANTADFTKRFMDLKKKYPDEQGWKLVDQLKTEPTVAHTKISDFAVSSFDDGSDLTEPILENENYALVIVSFKLKSDGFDKTTKTVQDTAFTIDTIRTIDPKTKMESMKITKIVGEIKPRTIEETKYRWNPEFMNYFKNDINPMVSAAAAAKVDCYMITAPNDPAVIKDFSDAVGAKFNIFYADDLVLKTIMRSNPGVFLMKKGTLIQKWHIRQLPSFETIKQTYMK